MKKEYKKFIENLLKEEEISSKYKKGTFGYWWTVIKGEEDIEGKDYHGNIITFKYRDLTSLEGSPKSVSGYFVVSSNKLTSLKGAPKYVGGDFLADLNRFVSLEGAPEHVGRDFSVIKNHRLTSLKGAPKYVGGNFNASGINFKNLSEKDFEDLKKHSRINGKVINSYNSGEYIKVYD